MKNLFYVILILVVVAVGSWFYKNTLPNLPNEEVVNEELKAIDESIAIEENNYQDNYDLKKVRILSSLVLLNIAPLHHYPYNIFLYYFGKDMLYRYINNKKDI